MSNLLFYLIFGSLLLPVLLLSPGHNKHQHSESRDTHDGQSQPEISSSWDGPVVTVEREESVHEASHSNPGLQEDDRFNENDLNEEVEHNRVIPKSTKKNAPPPPTTVTTTTLKNEPSNASRFGVASAILFTTAILLLIEF